ncbi:hydroxylase [Virgisporangium aliadipatigenens]|uniref:Hydroxylase n=1 Tax=Virgisporangium aliadipatigenens TaxID=741659 RepID=A0A8J3YGS5_9ACTN|nr:fumarylacetoacetate hydrolase family protein [Virgisporangium aliadipatigenens]GIJ43718.1 hydroxylase [Virgisporangium aliadipatigenens]
MRFATYRLGDIERSGVVADGRVHPFPRNVDLRAVVTLGPEAALRLGAEALDASDGVALDAVRLRPPLTPASIRDFVAFEEHVEGVRRSVDGAGGVPDAWYEAPTFYFTNPHTLHGPGDDVAFPARCADRDFELEVAVVLGGGGTSLTAAQARDAVFGYTVFNDWSARDLQRREMRVGLGPAKGKDFATTIGPWIVTADELEPHRDADGFLDLWCTASVNGVEVGRDLLSNMGWTFESLVAYASRDSRVEAGDVLASGTVGNGGCLAELWGRRGRTDPPPLRDGDEVTLTVQGIGSLTNRVTAAAPAPDLPPVRRRDPAAARLSGAAPLSGPAR